jgi:hypothetical protein
MRPRVAATLIGGTKPLHVLTYNLTRVMNLVGIKSLLVAIRA